MDVDDRLEGLWPGQAVEAFQRLGYRVDRLTDSHWLLDHPNRSPLQIPYHNVRALAQGLLLGQLQRAGFTPEEFLAELIP